MQVRRLAALLSILKLPVHALHAGMQQRQRLTSLDRFRANPEGVLVATDVAARGLDIPVRGPVHGFLSLQVLAFAATHDMHGPSCKVLLCPVSLQLWSQTLHT